MAVVRARSTPPYATIIFVFLWVIATGIAIWLGVQKGDADKKLADSEKRLAQVVKGSSDNATVDRLRAGSAGKPDSAIKIADAQISNLKGVIESAPDKSADDIVADANDALKAAGKPQGTLVAVIKDLVALTEQRKKTVDELEAQKTALETQLTKGIETNKAALDASTASLRQAQDAQSKAQAEAAKERTEKEALLTQKEATLTKTTEDAEKTRRELILKIQQLEQDVVAKDNNIKQLREQIAARRQTGAALASLPPAGTVVRTNLGTNECYISLGRKDRISPGMPFSVHDPRVGIKLQSDTDTSAKPDPEAGGKGGIEVLEVGENESLCRVTSLKKNQHVDVGDLIVNLFYQQDRNKKIHFVVFGDFDLDGDGVATPDERYLIVSMITKSGCIVDEALSPDVDFLVLGTRPAAPNAKTTDAAGGVADERIALQKKYDDLFTDAKRSTIPILNANRFLAIIGYYNTTVSH